MTVPLRCAGWPQNFPDVLATNPDRKKFAEIMRLCANGPVPFIIRLPNDQYTPAGVYAHLRERSRYAFLFESVGLDERLGRYSFMGAHPRRIYRCHEGKFSEIDSNGSEISSKNVKDPLAELASVSAPWRARWPKTLRLPPLAGGLVGYMGYDCAHYFEPVGNRKPDTIGMPDMVWMLADTVLCFDHLRSQIILSRCVFPGDEDFGEPGRLYDRMCEEAQQFVHDNLRMPALNPPSVAHALAADASPSNDFASNLTVAEFHDMVDKAKRHIRAGDIFQVVTSQRFTKRMTASPMDVYRALRKLNPSKYMFALRTDDCEAIGSSPETQVRCFDGRLEMTPIAGTCPRGASDEEDERLAAALLSDEKELAEHRMLVDLARNDLGRIAKAGSVKIDRLMEVTRHSHVMHIASYVSAQLASKYTFFDVLRATFPAGTLSGAPKVRAMQIINEFEKTRRNLYGGVIGYIDLEGNGDTCIAIRMLVAKDGVAHIQAGCGLVADSIPAREFDESVNKARALLHAVEEAERSA